MLGSLRSRLTLWYLAFFSVLFLLLCLMLYGGLSRSLQARLDETLISQASTAGRLMQEELEEMHGDAPRAAADVLSEVQPRGTVVAILEDINLLAGASPAQTSALSAASRVARELPGEDRAFALPAWESHGARAAARNLSYRNRMFTVLAVGSLDAIAADLRTVRQTLYIAFPVLLLLAGGGGYLLTRRGLAPLGRIAEQSQRITGHNLSARLEIGRAAEELESLAASFNELLARLDQSFDTMRRFVQDASH